ncbi:MAG: SRPBCC domain-containing protein [Chloroflexi bacterium]|nr:SRPBCC domain-containing protein [Chloroflexota bacterium]
MRSVITKQVTISRPIEQVWDALVDAASIAAWQGGGEVKSNARVGGRYAIFDGATTGKFTLVERPARLTYTWRQDNWEAAWPDSVVSWRLVAKGQGTVVRLRHQRLPNQEEFDGHASGWDEYFLHPMKEWLESRPPAAARSPVRRRRPAPKRSSV